MKNLLIITENIASTSIDEVKVWLGQKDETGEWENLEFIHKRNDFDFIIFTDDSSFSDISEHIKDLDYKNIYIVLHSSAEKTQIVAKNFEKHYNKVQIKKESHISNSFYVKIMPLLISNESITFAEVSDGFFSTDEEVEATDLLNKKLTFLHKLLGGKITQNDVDKTLNNFGYTEKIVYNKNNESIKKIRDLMLETF
jgi:hypothetical protein